MGEDGFCLSEIVTRLGGELRGDGSTRITQVGSLETAKAGQISFLASIKYRRQLAKTAASAVILAPAEADEARAAGLGLPLIVVPNPYAYYARVVALLNPVSTHPRGVHPSAVVQSEIPDSVAVGANAVIGSCVELGENVIIYPGVVLGDGVKIGEDSILYPNVVIGAACSIGKRAVIQAGAVIGSDGFGFAPENGRWLKIPQIGRVRIGDDVEIGANTSIDRGALNDTVIGNGVKIDNQIQIAHNCEIGDDTALAGCVGIAGSTKIGSRCTIGGAVMIVGHIEIADGTHIAGGSLVSKSITRPGQYAGSYPISTYSEWRKNAVYLKQLSRLAARIAGLERELASREK